MTSIQITLLSEQWTQQQHVAMSSALHGSEGFLVPNLAKTVEWA